MPAGTLFNTSFNMDQRILEEKRECLVQAIQAYNDSATPLAKEQQKIDEAENELAQIEKALRISKDEHEVLQLRVKKEAGQKFLKANRELLAPCIESFKELENTIQALKDEILVLEASTSI